MLKCLLNYWIYTVVGEIKWQNVYKSVSKTRKYSRNVVLPIYHQTLMGQKPPFFSENSWLDWCHSSCSSQNQYFEAFFRPYSDLTSISVPILLVGAPLSCQEQLLQHGILPPTILNQTPLGLGVCATGRQIRVRSIEFWSHFFETVQISNIQKI